MMIISLQTNSDFFLWPIPKRKKKLTHVSAGESQLKMKLLTNFLSDAMLH